LLAGVAGGGRVAARDRLALLNDSTSSMLLKPSGARASTASMTPSGPPRRFMCTISAVNLPDRSVGAGLQFPTLN